MPRLLLELVVYDQVVETGRYNREGLTSDLTRCRDACDEFHVITVENAM